LQVDAVNNPPSVANVVAGNGPSAATASAPSPAAASALSTVTSTVTTSGSFLTTAGVNGSVIVPGLTPATNYTVSLHLCFSGAWRLLVPRLYGICSQLFDNWLTMLASMGDMHMIFIKVKVTILSISFILWSCAIYYSWESACDMVCGTVLSWPELSDLPFAYATVRKHLMTDSSQAVSSGIRSHDCLCLSPQATLHQWCKADNALHMQVFMVAEDASGNVQPAVSVLQGIVTPNTKPPTFTFLNFTAPTVDQSTGLFAINMTVNTSVVGEIFYSIYR
jgi:hypothetical protein